VEQTPEAEQFTICCCAKTDAKGYVRASFLSDILICVFSFSSLVALSMSFKKKENFFGVVGYCFAGLMVLLTVLQFITSVVMLFRSCCGVKGFTFYLDLKLIYFFLMAVLTTIAMMPVTYWFIMLVVSSIAEFGFVDGYWMIIFFFIFAMFLPTMITTISSLLRRAELRKALEIVFGHKSGFYQ
jgi:hypothetical protein